MNAKNRKLIIVFSIISFLSVFGYGQGRIVFNHLNVGNGLSQNSVLAVAQDDEGLMWFGTRYCLNKYDSRDFTIYKHRSDQPGTMSSNEFVQAIHTDRKHRLWIGTRKGLNLYHPRQNSYTSFLKQNKPDALSSDVINCIYDDHAGNLWVGTDNGLSLLKNPETARFQSSFLTAHGLHSLAGYAVNAIFMDSQLTLWIGTDRGLFTLRRTSERLFSLEKFKPSMNSKGLSDQFITSLVEDAQKNIWVGTRSGGLNCIDFASKEVKHFLHDAANKWSIVNNFVRKIIIDKTGKLWIGTQEGLSIFDVHSYRSVSYVHNPSDPTSLSQNSIYDIYMDKQGSIWVGTYFGGINVVYNYTTPFNIWKSSEYQSSLSSNIISSIIEDKNRNLWIGTEASGLSYYNRSQGKFTHYKNDLNKPGSLSSNLVKSVYEDQSHNIWIATHLSGLELFDPKNSSFKHYRHTSDLHSISSNNVSCLLEDKSGRFWVGTESGLNLCTSKRDGHFMVLQELKTQAVNYLMEDSKANIWAATNDGVFLLKPNDSVFKPLGDFKNKPKGLMKVNCIFEDGKGNIWFGMFHGGLLQYNPTSGENRLYRENDGLPSENVLEILEESEGLLWISSDKGLSRFDVKRHVFNNFDEHDGLPGTEFNNNSKLKDSDGKLYFGSFNGLVSFDPKEIQLNKTAPKIILTDFKLFNRSITIGDSTRILTQSISFTDKLNLKYDQNVFTISFALLNYIKTEKNKFAFLLKGIDKDWNYTNTGSAAYAGLPAGNYTLMVKGANNDGVWCKEPATIAIRIHPPLWRTVWAYLAYAVVIAVVLYYIIRFFRERARLERDLYYEHLQYERQQELYHLKLNFFTKISHEIRTPLTLILGPLERLVDLTKDFPAVHPYLENIKKNGDRLLRLVSELLDFRKIESGKMPLHIVEQDLVSFCLAIFSTFKSLAHAKNIDYQFKCRELAIPVHMDKSQLEKVFYNLLSNAFKFTGEGGQIILEVECVAPMVRITVTDNGIGIPEAELAKIFNDFYQIENPGTHAVGSGIGLALAKEIVLLHGGEIKVNSKTAEPDGNGWTKFAVQLPMVNEKMNDAVPKKEVEKRVETILIIEDNDEMREFIMDSIGGYPFISGSNGKEGLEQAIAIMPDLIISDVMMPIMDGLELCERIKSDDRTSHIPVILLTARDAQAHYVEGFSTGADAYITKPFSPQVLRLQVNNLLRLKETLREKYAKQLILETTNVQIESSEEKFLNRLVKVIDANIGNADFNISKLAEEIGMSQAVLYKKFSALTNMALADFIKTERLKQAAGLLAGGKYTVAEIAYAVGYNDRKYFSKEFRKHFGLSPSEYLNKHKNY